MTNSDSIIENIVKSSLKEDYTKHKTLLKIAEKHNVSIDNIKLLFDYFDISYKKYGFKKYKCKEQTFSIDNEISYYLAGFIAADGCIHKHHRTNKNNRLRIGLSGKDETHLNKILSCLESNHKVFRYTNKNSKYNPKWNDVDTVFFEISSNQITNDLKERFGIGPRKTFDLKFPKLKPDIIHHFMRGYFDGDGSLSKKTGREYYVFSVRGNLDFLSSYKRELARATSCNDTKIITSGSIPSLVFSKKTDVVNICNFLYKDSTIHLLRKKIRAERHIKYVNSLNLKKEIDSTDICNKYAECKSVSETARFFDRSRNYIKKRLRV